MTEQIDRCGMSATALFDLVEVTICGCGHRALDHHGVDNDHRNGGCFGSGSGHPWSPVPKCACKKTCAEVSA